MMSDAGERVVRCTACDRPGSCVEPFYYEWRGRRFDLYRCPQCTHQFVYPPVGVDDQALIYSDAYFSESGDWACGVFEGGYREATPKLVEEARQILAMLPVGGGRLLDVGCAGGVFLNEARARGFEVYGLELNGSMAEYARATYGLGVLNQRMEDVPVDHWVGAFDVVTLLDCLEHVPAPLHAMRKIGNWVCPGGVVFIRGPLANSRLGRLKEGIRRAVRVRKRLPGYPLDANTFNKRSLTSLLASTGFQRPVWIGATSSFANVWARRA
jgi:SAM-dependent methyltransferase